MKRTIIRLHLEEQPEGGYTVTSPDVPDLVTEGNTVEECLVRAEDLAKLLFEFYVAHGKPLPAPFQTADKPRKKLDLALMVGLG